MNKFYPQLAVNNLGLTCQHLFVSYEHFINKYRVGFEQTL